ncbi:MAG TPA: crotonase/enoyl-CoA hydratase family protein [Sphingobium sp.]|nr:crotonase/enoyl-CoA hydratase family protein [Sphingobium sp.]
MDNVRMGPPAPAREDWDVSVGVSPDPIPTDGGAPVTDPAFTETRGVAWQAGDAAGLALPGRSKLFDLGQIDVQWDPDLATLWAFTTPVDRPNYNLGLLRDTMAWQMETRRAFENEPDALQYMVLGSRFPGVFNLGGDLEMFARCIENQDRETLRQYSHLCVDIVDRVWHCNDMPVINIGLAQGDALGGGFEALLCFDVIIAERQARFGLPEVLFGLFPGMGAYSILARRLGHAVAERMILSGKVYSAEEMQEMGIITVLADCGQGEEVTRQYIAANRDRHAGQLGVYRAGRRVNPIDLAELRDIVDGWVDTAMKLTDRDLKMMRRLAAAQTRLHRR